MLIESALDAPPGAPFAEKLGYFNRLCCAQEDLCETNYEDEDGSIHKHNEQTLTQMEFFKIVNKENEFIQKRLN